MRKIAVTQRIFKNADYPETREALDVRWVDFLAECGFMPVILSSRYDFNTVYRESPFDGILLTGGNDLSSQANNRLSQERDCFEKALVAFARKESLPVLGVCRGMQLIAEVFCALIKEVPSHIAVNHTVTLNPDSAYATLLHTLREVNSFHRFAVAKEPGGFLVSVRSGDGTIEAMESCRERIFCQMWHPERNRPFAQADIDLFKHFFR